MSEKTEERRSTLGDRMAMDFGYSSPMISAYDKKTGEDVPFDQCVARGLITQERYDEIVEYARAHGQEFRDGRWRFV